MSDDKILNQIEENLDDFYMKSTFHPDFSGNLEGNVRWVLAKKSDWPNCIYRANIKELNMQSVIKNIKNQMKKGIIPNEWKVGPLSTPLNLSEFLIQNGFKNVYHRSGMVLDLRRLENQSIDLDIRIVKDDYYLQEWANCVSEVFNGIKISIGLLKFLQKDTNFTFYIGLENNKVVSTLMLVISPEGISGLRAVSTLPDYRGNGYAEQVSRKALQDAYQKDCRMGVLQASEFGEKVYAKLGFKKYCNMYSYELELNK